MRDLGVRFHLPDEDNPFIQRPFPGGQTPAPLAPWNPFNARQPDRWGLFRQFEAI